MKVHRFAAVEAGANPRSELQCLKAGPPEVVVAMSEQSRDIDGASPRAEGEAGVAWRKGLLRQIGYKL